MQVHKFCWPKFINQLCFPRFSPHFAHQKAHSAVLKKSSIKPNIFCRILVKMKKKIMKEIMTYHQEIVLTLQAVIWLMTPY